MKRGFACYLSVEKTGDTKYRQTHLLMK